MPSLTVFRPAALTLCLIAAIALPLGSDAATKKKKPAPPKAPPAPTACTDFYAFANADWLKAHPAPASGGISALGELAARAEQQQRDLLEAAAKSSKTPVQKLLGDFWASGLDEAEIDRDGAAAIASLLTRINAIKKPQDVAPVIATLHQAGVPVAFDFVAAPDPRNPDTDLGFFVAGGLGLPDATFYTRGDADARAFLGHYNGYVQKILGLSGTASAQLGAEAQQVIDLETRIARATKAGAGFTPVAVKDLAKRYKNLQFEAFLKAQGVGSQQVSIADTALFAQIDKLIASQKPAQWKTFLRFQVGNAMAAYMGKPWRDAEHEFRGRLLRGDEDGLPRWKQTLNAIDTLASGMLAQEYVEKHLPANDRERAQTTAQRVRDALAAAIDANTWMEAPVKAEARAKLDKLRIGIAMPRQALDFTGVNFERGNYAGNALAAMAWSHREQMRRIGRGNADATWNIAPYSLSLAYDPAGNRLLITAAVLQPPVFDSGQGAAAQYGSLGAIIGHELVHALEGKGRSIDAAGAARDWWTSGTAAAWDARIAPLTARYAGIAYPGRPDLKIDGARTRVENASDLAGLELAWAAFLAAEPQANTTSQQNFFRAWARLWSQSFAADATAQQAARASHAPGIARTNVPATQLPAFGKAFACKPGNPMLLPENEQVSVWR